ncbi:MAG TPA: hypothetical protein VGK89_02580 [Candidatus Eisenbacteria bacterium]
MSPDTRAEDPRDRARFVFQGTVKKLRASALDEVPASDRTVVVRVERVIHAPEVLGDCAGEDVTVRLAEGETVKSGESLIFHTRGWIFGQGIAVESVGHDPATKRAVTALSHHPGDPAKSLRAREAMEQSGRADLIVTGRVSAVRAAPRETPARASRTASGTAARRVSEHDPLWQEAVIEVEEVHKGRNPGPRVVVCFPKSADVRWHLAPKFRKGQRGVFLLHREQLVRGAARAGGAARGAGLYTALHPADVQPLAELPRIRRAAGKARG